jgi:hypothetical protein
MTPIMKRHAVHVFIIALLALIAAPVAAQSIASGLSGSWMLQADAEAARNRRPITGLSIATELVIRQSATEVSVDSNTGSEGATVTTTYRLDGGQHPITGPIGWKTVARTAWDGTKMVVDIKRSVAGPEGELVFDIRETYTPAGDTLTVERVQGKAVQRLVYRKK